MKCLRTPNKPPPSNPKNVIKNIQKIYKNDTYELIISLNMIICLSIDEKYNSFAKFI